MFIGTRLSRKAVEYPDSKEEISLESLPGLPPRYSYNELEAAIEGFSKTIGEGGSAIVYKGLIQRHQNDSTNMDMSNMNTGSAIKVAVK